MKKRPLAVVQARMGSTRLPGKVLAPIVGKPALELMVERLRYIEPLEEVVIATTDLPEDAPIAELAQRLGCAVYRGKAQDVLDRYYQVARLFDARAVVRFTADCPLIDPAVSAAVIEGFAAGDFDYVSLAGDFPDGLDTEVIGRAALEIAWQEAKLPSEREHVTPFIWKNPDRFRVGRWELPGFRRQHRASDRGQSPVLDLSQLRWTLDHPEDLELIRAIYERLYAPGPPFGWREIVALMEKEPELCRLNAGILRNEGYLQSVASEGGRLRPDARRSCEGPMEVR